MSGLLHQVDRLMERPGRRVLLFWWPSLLPRGFSVSSRGAGCSEEQCAPICELGLVAMSSEGVDTDSKPHQPAEHRSWGFCRPLLSFSGHIARDTGLP